MLQLQITNLEAYADEGDYKDQVETDLNDHDDQKIERVLLFLPQRHGFDPLSVLSIRLPMYGLGVEEHEQAPERGGAILPGQEHPTAVLCYGTSTTSWAWIK